MVVCSLVPDKQIVQVLFLASGLKNDTRTPDIIGHFCATKHFKSMNMVIVVLRTVGPR